ncbi:hypothetical protein AGDE_13259 [Angomonas deanei]|nr:hypothetical protein AGDE_13259 [Angomonas deanei]|eukprot:EPY22529.1 hypothetical protein AGDE_13259 [Angomonas deanei]
MSGPDATRPACWEELDKEVECIEADRVFVEEQEKEVTENIEHAAGNIKLLETLLAKNEVSSPLAESVRDSCVYHGEKLARLGAAIEESSGRFQGTALDIKDGSTYRSLQETIATLKRLEEVFETERAAAVDGGDKSPASDCRQGRAQCRACCFCRRGGPVF